MTTDLTTEERDEAYLAGTRDPWTLELARREGARAALTDLDTAIAAAQASLRLAAVEHLRIGARPAAHRCETKRLAHQITRNEIAQRLAALTPDPAWAPDTEQLEVAASA